jgi:hypothetical protein
MKLETLPSLRTSVALVCNNLLPEEPTEVKGECMNYEISTGGQSIAFDRCNRLIVLTAMIVAISAPLVLSGCKKTAPSSDSTPPRVYILKWEKNPQGGQGPQTTVQPGGQFTVATSWLGTNKADIRVYGEDKEGVRKLTVSGSATGPCSTKVDSNGQFSTSPGPLSASFPAQTQTAPAGQVEDFFAIHLDDLLANASCGTHQYANMPHPAEFFLDSGTWTITAIADNCCGGQTTGTFKIAVQ